MFTMMNRARLAVGLQGVGIAERATQQATAMRASEQGRDYRHAGEAIGADHRRIHVKRMLMTMRALTQAARAS